MSIWRGFSRETEIAVREYNRGMTEHALATRGKPWSEAEEHELARLLLANIPPVQIAKRMKRSETAILGKMQHLRRRARGQISPYAVRRESPLAA
jgi:DNA-binding CsgD family transcriptional regulator